jgi:hypothetical protein
VGGVRSTLPDMIAYAKAQLRPPGDALGRAITLTQKEVLSVQRGRMAMNWFLVPLGGRTVLSHGGGTGGFSSFVLIDPQAGRAVVVLSDTALNELGVTYAIAAHLIDPTQPLGEPRKVATPSGALLDALVGRYRLETGLGIVLRRKGDALAIQADGQAEFEMGYDSAGDFYALDFDALLRPVRKADGSYSFTLHQGGGVYRAERIDAATAPRPTVQLSAEELKAFEGDYPLTPTFSLRVFAQGARLYVQGTGQGPVEIVPVAKDVFVNEAVGAEVTFERDASGNVIALVLKQAGQTLRGVKR